MRVLDGAAAALERSCEDARSGSAEVPEGEPQAIVAGDFTGIGRSDLAIADRSGYVTVVLSQPNGQLEAAPGSPIITGGAPSDIATGDLTGNGKLDLVTADGEDAHAVSVLLGDGTGHFTQAPGSPIRVPRTPDLRGGAEGIPTSIAIGDFNGDRIPDLAVGSVNGEGSIAILLGDGKGGFTNSRGSPCPAGGNPEGLVVGDFNGDGREDVAVANPFVGTVTVLDNLPGLAPTQCMGFEGLESTERTERGGLEWSEREHFQPGGPIISPFLSPPGSGPIELGIKTGRLKLELTAPGAGRAVVDWYLRPAARHAKGSRGAPVLVASGRATFANAGTKVLLMKLTRSGRKMLRGAPHVTLIVSAVFTPEGGHPTSVQQGVRW